MHTATSLRSARSAAYLRLSEGRILVNAANVKLVPFLMGVNGGLTRTL
jgi:hypothetical protein